MKKTAALQGLAFCTASLFALCAGASTVSAPGFDVDAIDAIYNANSAGTYSTGNPVAYTLPAGAISFTVNNVTGSLSFNSHGNSNDADGIGAAVGTSSNTGTGTISGITAPNAGYLVGLFLGSTTGAAPVSSAYTTTDFTSYSPLLQQVFFIGDGLTGDGTGDVQTFVVPTGATQLFLGFSDAPGYNGAPGAYDDNSGFLNGGSVVFTIADAPGDGNGGSTGVPEPAGVALLGAGFLAAALARRKR